MTKKQKIKIAKLFRDFKRGTNLVARASSMICYEDEKDPNYGVKSECDKFLIMVMRDYMKRKSTKGQNK